MKLVVGNDDFGYGRTEVPVYISVSEEDELPSGEISKMANELHRGSAVPFRSLIDYQVYAPGALLTVSLRDMRSEEIIKVLKSEGHEVIQDEELLCAGEEERYNGRPASEWDGER